MTDTPDDTKQTNTEETIQPGNLVWLKSGSPALTVHATSESGVDVIWMGSTEVHEARFPAVCLTQIPTPN